MKEATNPTDPLGTMPQEPWHPGKAAKPDRTDRVIQLNYGEVRTHASYKTTRTWENLNKWERIMIVLLQKLWSKANNFWSFGASQ